MDNWEDRLAPAIKNPSKNWEDRLRSVDLSPPPNPAAEGNTLQIYNPFGKNMDTGLSIGAPTQNFLAGAGKSIYDLGRGIAQKVGGYSFADAAEQKKLDAPLMSTRAGTAGNVAGSVATGLSAAFIPGVNTLAGAGALGVGMGLIQPATGFGDMALNTGVGGVAGVAGNLAGRGIGATYGLAKSTFQPFFKAGQQGIADDIIRQFAPNAGQAVRNIAADAGEIVPGSLPTAAEAAQVPGLAQLTKQVRQTPGIAAQADFLAREQANNAARVAAARTVAGDEGQRAFFDASRNTAANELYGKAFSVPIVMDDLSASQRGEITKLLNMPAVRAGMQQARENAANHGMSLKPDGSIAGLHQTKLAMDDAINKLMVGGAPSQVNKAMAITAARDRLVTFMEKMSPDYGEARATYAAMSEPINQMDVGKALADKLIPAIRDYGGNANLRSAGFTEALRHGDATAQRVLGMPTAGMENVLGPQHMATLNALGADLARSQNAGNLAKAAGSDTVQNALSQNIIRNTMGPLGLPSSMADNTLLATILRPAQYIGSLAEPKVMDRVGATLLSPAETSQALLRSKNPKAIEAALKGLLRYSAPVGTSGLLANLPQQQ